MVPTRPGKLLKRVEFQAVYRHGQKSVGRYIVLFSLRREEAAGCRVGITTTRKLGGAVLRNRARRRLREVVRREGELLQQWSADLVINVRPGCAEVEWDTLVRDFGACLKKLIGPQSRRS